MLLTCVARRKRQAWTQMRSLPDMRSCATHSCRLRTYSRRSAALASPAEQRFPIWVRLRARTRLWRSHEHHREAADQGPMPLPGARVASTHSPHLDKGPPPCKFRTIINAKWAIGNFPPFGLCTARHGQAQSFLDFVAVHGKSEHLRYSERHRSSGVSAARTCGWIETAGLTQLAGHHAELLSAAGSVWQTS
jgi:hypothetical protein